MSKASVIKVSIVTVTYNDPVGLDRTLSSLAKGQPLSWMGEVVVVDSSPSQNQTVIDKYKDALHILHKVEPRNGIYSAMNVGWQSSSHELVWFLNGGDAFDSNCDLSSALEEFLSLGRDALCLSANLLEDGIFKYTKGPPRDFFRAVVAGNGICHQAMIYRKLRFQKLFPFDTKFRLAADYELHLRAWLEGCSLATVPTPLVNYDTSGASSNFRAVLREYKLAIEKNSFRIPFGLRQLMLVGYRWEQLRIESTKILRSFPGIRKLRPLWFRWKNRSSK